MNQLSYANVKVTFREVHSTLAIMQYYVATKMPRQWPFTGFEYKLLDHGLLGNVIVSSRTTRERDMFAWTGAVVESHLI